MREAWWVITHYEGKRKQRRVGTTAAHKREAEEMARKINASLALGTFAPDRERLKPLPCDVELRRWHTSWAPTVKPSYEIEAGRIIRVHLVPFFGSKDVREIREEDLLRFVRVKLDAGLAPKTIRNALQVLVRDVVAHHLVGVHATAGQAHVCELPGVRRSGRSGHSVIEEWHGAQWTGGQACVRRLAKRGRRRLCGLERPGRDATGPPRLAVGRAT